MKAKILFATPRYGAVERESDASLTVAAGPEVEIHPSDKFTSALPHQFSQSWADLMTTMHEHKWSHFGMLHSDVAPVCVREDEAKKQRVPTFWLQTMLEEMDRCALDVIHALVPIKGPMGVYSTAIGVSTEPFCRLRRVAIKEYDRLPDTFTAKEYLDAVGCDDWPADATPVMMNNTGCMLVRWRPEFARFHGFRFITHLMTRKAKGAPWKHMADGTWEPGDEVKSFFWPEDWDFGQWCHRNGLRVGATKKVETFHYGRHGFCCDPSLPWAWDRDRGFWDFPEGQYT